MVRSPEFPAHLTWVNCTRPLSLKGDLAGRVVLLEFWTSCCINCHHNLANLRELRARFGPEVALVGVHSGKFPYEADPEAIARACHRLGVYHPVVCDSAFEVWDLHAVRSWPTLVVIDPTGRIRLTISGEFRPERVVETIEELLQEFSGRLETGAPDYLPEVEPRRADDLHYPSKVIMEGDRLFVADTGHHRILELRLESEGVARVLGRFGGPGPGLCDGLGPQARFREPRGLALSGDCLWVADTGNHALRRIDLSTRQVVTVAGDGHLGAPLVRPTGPPRECRLRSPWDVLVEAEGTVWLAMAGSHQIWRLDGEQLLIWAGNGREALMDGPLSFASFNQPSGLARGPEGLYVADAEASAIRLLSGPAVSTLVGLGLFEFGDRDGLGREARLQHPAGLAWGGDRLYIADSYNHRVRRLDPETLAVTVLAGDGRAGLADGPFLEARFNEPEGLAWGQGRVVVADTGNHCLRLLDLERGWVSTLELGWEPAERQALAGRPLELRLPPGWSLNPLSRMSVRSHQGAPTPLGEVPGGACEVDLTLYLCRESDGLCSAWRSTLELSPGRDPVPVEVGELP